ncbi:MAG: hypothetical protein PHH00_03130 [Candidatus Nanoarchaeia archaeon]|nr:hypothetical protein [Candidatus Nanoarchaeia archaeon]
MPTLNEKWAAQVLGLEWQPAGIDLTGDRCIVEVKFSLPREIGWTVLEYQMAYPNQYPDKRAYWGLGEYTLNKKVDEIKAGEELERLVIQRELWLVDWSWMNQFPPSETSGKTEISEWQHTLRYPKKKLVPETIKSYDVRKGKVHLTQGINPEDFNFE